METVLLFLGHIFSIHFPLPRHKENGQGQQFKAQNAYYSALWTFFALRRHLDYKPKFLHFIGTPTHNNFILLNHSPMTFLCEVLLFVFGPLRLRQYVIQGP